MARESYETPDPREAESYPHWAEHRLRFADMDMLRHANHAAIMGVLESARVEFWKALGLYPFPADEGIMQVRTEVDYLGQLYAPARLRVGSRVARVGEKSAVWRQGLFDESGRCATVMATVSAYADYEAARSKPIPDALKDFLRAELDKRGPGLPTLETGTRGQK